MYFVICYDIADDKRRRNVEKLMSAFGHRVQESVFEAELDEKRYLQLRTLVGKVMDEQEDNIRFYRQCLRCKTAIEILGIGPEVENGPQILIF